MQDREILSFLKKTDTPPYLPYLGEGKVLFLFLRKVSY